MPLSQKQIGLLILSSWIGWVSSPAEAMAQSMARHPMPSLMRLRMLPAPPMPHMTHVPRMMGHPRMARSPVSTTLNHRIHPFSFRSANLTALNLLHHPFVNPYTSPQTANPYSSLMSPVYLSGYGSNANGGYGAYPMSGYGPGSAGGDNSVGNLLKDIQEANLLKELVRQAKIETQHQEAENALWNRDHLPTAEDDRQRALREQLKRSLTDPPSGEIWSGQALNTILDDLAGKVGGNSASLGALMALDADTLHHLNFTASQGGGNPGLLKNEGRLAWPPALKDPHYQANRDLLNDLAPVLYAQAVAHRVDPSTLQVMNQTVEQLQRQVDGKIRTMTPTQYSEARRFLRHLDEALKLLRQPNAGRFFTVEATTVSQLVQHLVRNGWRFASAVPGDEAAYLAMHRALVAYDLALRTTSQAEQTKK
jgi:hypothetical protein